MKTFILTLLSLCLTNILPAQGLPNSVAPAPLLQRDELRDLLGPIALYPDPLIALILPASTAPADIVLAARFLASGEDLATVNNKPWEDSVKSLTRYPDTVKWLDENLEWTTQLGDAYTAQPSDVMDAIQELRTQAQSVGNLIDTPQQRIIQEESYVRIIPANPQYIYVPQYQPEIVYYQHPVAEPLLWFGSGYRVGSWLNYDFDWHRHRLYCGEWREGWDYHHKYDDRDRRRDDVVFINNNITNYRVWQSDPARRPVSGHHFAARNDDNHSHVVLPTSFTNVTRSSESVRRAIASDSVKPFLPKATDKGRVNEHNDKHHVTMPQNVAPDILGSIVTPHSTDHPGANNGKGHVVMPKTTAPGITGILPHLNSDPTSNDSNGNNRKDTLPDQFKHRDNPQPTVVLPHVDPRKPHVDAPQQNFNPIPKQQQHDNPKPHVDGQKQNFNPMPKQHVSAPKQNFNPMPTQQQHDNPKPHVDVPKQNFNPIPKQHVDSPKPQSSPQSRSGSSGSGDSKKKDKDKDKNH